MPQLTSITGTVVDINGVVLRDAVFVVERVGGQAVSSGDVLSAPDFGQVVTNSDGLIGTMVEGEFSAGINLVRGHSYKFSVSSKFPFYATLKHFFLYPDSASGDILDFFVEQPVPSIAQSSRILLEAFGAAALSQAWAESPTPPDPDNPDSKSSKVWASESASSALLSSVNAQNAAVSEENSATNAALSSMSSASAESSAIAAGALIYPSTATGISATASGQFFYVPEFGGLVVHENVSGVATHRARIGQPVFALMSVLVAAVASGYTPAIGTAVPAGAVWFLFVGGDDENLSGLPGWVPFGDYVTPTHCGPVSQSSDSKAALLAAEEVAQNLGLELVIDRPCGIAGGATFSRNGVKWRFSAGWLQLLTNNPVVFSGANCRLAYPVIDGTPPGSDPITGVALHISGEDMTLDQLRVNNHAGLDVYVTASANRVCLTPAMDLAIRVDQDATGIDINGQDRTFYKPAEYVSHRGAGFGRGPGLENTIHAFTHTAAMGFDIWETDVMVTSDGVPVLFHDTDVSTLTTGTGEVKDANLATVQGWQFNAALGTDFADLYIPTLAEFMALAQEYRPKQLHIEFKAIPNGNDDIAAIAGIVRASGMAKQTLYYTGRGIEELEFLRTIEKDAEVMLFRASQDSFTDADLVSLSRMGKAYALVSFGQLPNDWDFVNKCHELGIRVVWYTVNQYTINKPFWVNGGDQSYFDRLAHGMGV